MLPGRVRPVPRDDRRQDLTPRSVPFPPPPPRTPNPHPSPKRLWFFVWSSSPPSADPPMSPVELYFCGCGSEGGAPSGLSAAPPPGPGNEARTCDGRLYLQQKAIQTEKTQRENSDTALDRLPDASEEQGNTKRDYFFLFLSLFFQRTMYCFLRCLPLTL